MEAIQKTGHDLYMKLNGVATCYDDLGTGFPIIFIHGFPLDKSTWQPQMEFLSKTNRVIAFDLRGFGKSTPRKEKVTIASFADDLIIFMDNLGIKKAIVCGLSMGGYILINAINRYPERFEAIVLSDTQCTVDSPDEIEIREKKIQQIKLIGLTEFADDTIKHIFCKNTLKTKKELVEKIAYLILSTSVIAISGALTAMAKLKEMYSTLNKIEVPTLIICGKEDTVTPTAQSEFLNNNIKNSKLVIIENAGHLSNLEQPEEFNVHLRNFVAEVVEKKSKSVLLTI